MVYRYFDICICGNWIDLFHGSWYQQSSSNHCECIVSWGVILFTDNFNPLFCEQNLLKETEGNVAAFILWESSSEMLSWIKCDTKVRWLFSEGISQPFMSSTDVWSSRWKLFCQTRQVPIPCEFICNRMGQKIVFCLSCINYLLLVLQVNGHPLRMWCKYTHARPIVVRASIWSSINPLKIPGDSFGKWWGLPSIWQ